MEIEEVHGSECQNAYPKASYIKNSLGMFIVATLSEIIKIIRRVSCAFA